MHPERTPKVERHREGQHLLPGSSSPVRWARARVRRSPSGGQRGQADASLLSVQAVLKLATRTGRTPGGYSGGPATRLGAPAGALVELASGRSGTTAAHARYLSRYRRAWGCASDVRSLTMETRSFCRVWGSGFVRSRQRLPPKPQLWSGALAALPAHANDTPPSGPAAPP